MKKYLLLFLIAGIIFSCSSDNEDSYNLDDAVVIGELDLIPPTTDQRFGGYSQNIYRDGDKDICVSYYWADNKTGKPTYASIGTCPKCNYEKQIYVFSEETKKIENGVIFINPFYLCEWCKSRFNINTGKAMNEQAKGYSMPIYRAKSKFDGFRFIEVYVWK